MYNIFHILFEKVASLRLFSGQFAFIAKKAVLWFEQKNFLYFHNEKNRDTFASRHKPTMLNLFKLD